MDFTLLINDNNEEKQPRSIKGSKVIFRNKVSLNNTLLITALDDLVPADHLVRKLNEAPRIDPIILFKIVIVIETISNHKKTDHIKHKNVDYMISFVF